MSEEIIRCEQCGGRFDRPGLFSCTDGHATPTEAQRIVAVIEADICNRRGLKGVWESIDEDTQDEIRDKWADLIYQMGEE